ncbi:MAG: hypothetical protein IRY87_05665 [Acetobacteraceae bacterium]|nr:hypothetical protein [Acetobacteraceae bacterium]
MNSKIVCNLREEARFCRKLAAQMSLRPDAEKLLAQAKELEDKAAALEANSRQPEEISAKGGLTAPTDAKGVAERRFVFVDAVLGA